MTREEAAKRAELYKAYADGKEIQVEREEGWVSIGNPFFDGPISLYRVNPEVKKSIGYKRYLRRYEDKVHVFNIVKHEGENVDGLYSANFIKFIDWEWQYEEFTEDDL